MTEASAHYYIGLVCCFVFGATGYNVGYMSAQETYQVTTKYRCHNEVVYRWTGGYWDKLGQACKTDEQMKEKNT
jgi:hypothetical protein